MRKIIQLGESLRLYVDYLDDPTALRCEIKWPDGTGETIVYPTPDFVRETLGSYYLRLNPAMTGTHSYAIRATFSTGDEDVRSCKFDVEPRL